MTYLELVAAVGSVPMDIACMYFNGRLTEREMKNVIGWKKAGLVNVFICKIEMMKIIKSVNEY